MAKKDKDDVRKPDLKKYKDQEEEFRTLLAAGRLKEAHKILKILDREYGEYAPLYILWADYFKAKGMPGNAEMWYDAAIETDRSNKAAYIAYAKFFDQLQKYEEASEVLWRGVRDSGDPLHFYSILELFYTNLGNQQKALEIVESVSKEFKDRGEIYYKKAEAAFGLDLYPEAIDLFRQSLDKDFIGEWHYRYLAKCFAWVSHNEEAVVFWKKAIARNPEESSIYQELHTFLMNNYNTGDQDLLTALKLKMSMMTGELDSRLNLTYLEADKSFYLRYLGKYLKIDRQDLSLDYANFCEFYKNVLLYKNDFRSRYFDPKSSLLVCVNRLKELKCELPATLYEGWYYGFDGLQAKARTLFDLIINNQDEMQAGIVSSAQQGISYITERSEEIEIGKKTGQIDLSNYGIDLTRMAHQKKILGKKGKEEIVRRIAENIIKGSTKSLILTGPSGVGKTEVIRQFAHLLTSTDCPGELKGYRIVQTSTSDMIKGAKYIGVWERQLMDLCSNCSRENRIIVYLEDIENIFGAGRYEGSAKSFADYLIPRMEQNQIIILGELDSYQAQTVFFDHPRFERVITEIRLEQPDSGEIIDILRGETDNLKTVFSTESLREVIDLTETFMPYKAFPGKAVELLKTTAELLGGKGGKKETEITIEDIVLAFCETTGIPDFIVDRTQKLDPHRMDQYFNERVLGQREAIDSVKNAVTTFKARLSERRKPIKSFLFVGPTGVGKTELAKVLSDYIFGSPDRVIRLDMSEYSEFDAVSKIIGSHRGWPPKSSDFINRVRRDPFSVVLLDEIEKADNNVLNMLLQLLDEGTLSDAEGKPVYFQTTIIIMTSNLGSRHYTSQAIGFGQEADLEDLRQSVLSDVKQFFSPEIYNRFDEVICFKPLTRDVLGIIINREIGKVLERRGIIGMGVEIDIDPLVKEYIVEIGYDPKYGARHIKRAVEKSVAVPLAGLIASSDLKEGDCIRINMRQGLPTADIVSSRIKDSTQTIRADKTSPEKLSIPDRGLAKTIDAIEGRIDSLKAKFNYNEILSDREDLQNQMINPTFWDDPSRARNILKRFSELNRKTERMHKWEKIHDRIRSSFKDTSGGDKRHETSRIRSQIIGLLKDLESAEMEILLEGKYDFADAFVILHSLGSGQDDIRWMLDMAGVYSSWAKRRGYQYKIFGEQPRDKSGGSTVFLYIGGMNAFGLLKNERGIHRKIDLKKSGKKQVKKNIDCEILVLADVQPLDNFQEHFDVSIKKISPPRKGWRMRSLSRQVILNHQISNLNMNFLSDVSLEKDRNLPNDMFMSYVHYQSRKSASLLKEDKGVWGSLVRTYETFDGSRITDHKTEIVIRSIKDYLGGKIDSLLLERLI